MALVNAADRLAIIEDDPVLKVGHRRGAFEIAGSQREGHGPEVYAGVAQRKAQGQPPNPRAYSQAHSPDPLRQRSCRIVAN